MDEKSPKSGADTRERLIEAAGQVFAEKGLHGAVVREITQRAGANIAAINYYFHDKFELYTEVLRRAHQDIVEAMQVPLTAETPEGRLRQLLTAIIQVSFDPDKPEWRTRLIGRELFQPTKALDLLDEFMRPTSTKLWGAIAEIRQDFTEEQILLVVSDVIASCLFHVHHAHLLKRMFPTIPEPGLDTLTNHIVDSVLFSLTRGQPNASSE